MQLVAGIALAVIGLGLLIASFATPALGPLRSSGGGALFLGLVGIGLSFVKPPNLDEPVAPMPFGARLAGMFFEPSKVFQNLRVHPRWVLAVALGAAAFGVYQFEFVRRVTPEVIAQTMTDKTAETTESFTQQPMPAEQKAKMRDDQLQAFKSPAGRAAQFANVFIFSALFTFLFGALYLLLSLAFGGKLNYWQGVAVAAHAGLPVALLSSLLNLIVLFIKPLDDISPIRGLNGLATTDLGSLLINPAERPVIFTLLSVLGIFSLYGLWLTATGLKNAGTKVSGASAWGVALTLFILGALLRIVAAALFPSFVS
jgi:hypothetical protein